MSQLLLSPLVMAIPDGALEHSFGDEEPKVVGFLEKIKPTRKTRNFRSPFRSTSPPVPPFHHFSVSRDPKRSEDVDQFLLQPAEIPQPHTGPAAAWSGPPVRERITPVADTQP
jgi:hypothetical protein